MSPSPLTADELLDLHMPGKRTELVDGALVVREPAGGRHGYVAITIGGAIAAYVTEHGLGFVFAAETGFKLSANPDTVRAADVAFVTMTRMPEGPPHGYPEIAPDLVVEVVSPNDRPKELARKTMAWLTAGTRLVWIIHPVVQGARIYRADGSFQTLRSTDSLAGEDVLPGFSYGLDRLGW